MFKFLLLPLLILPAYARFIEVDPKRQYASPYVYAGNNPVMIYDPDGQEGIAFGLMGEFTAGVAGHAGIMRAIGTQDYVPPLTRLMIGVTPRFAYAWYKGRLEVHDYYVRGGGGGSAFVTPQSASFAAVVSYTAGPVSNFAGASLAIDVNIHLPARALMVLPPRLAAVLEGSSLTLGITQEGVQGLVAATSKEQVLDILDRNLIYNLAKGVSSASKVSVEYSHAIELHDTLDGIRQYVIDPANEALRDEIVKHVKETLVPQFAPKEEKAQ